MKLEAHHYYVGTVVAVLVLSSLGLLGSSAVLVLVLPLVLVFTALISFAMGLSCRPKRWKREEQSMPLEYNPILNYLEE